MEHEHVKIPHSSPWITSGDRASISEVLDSVLIARGSICEELERKFQQYLGSVASYTASSGQEALMLALRSVGVSAGQEVLLPSYVCEAVLYAVLATGAVPVCCDIADDWCLDIESVEAHLSKKTSAIIAVHTFGISCDVSGLKQFNVPVIEDCCQKFSPKVGLTGDVAIFSFHATKCLTTGEGGLVTTAKEEIAVSLRTELKNKPGRLCDIQAALGLSQLSRYHEMLARRADIAAYYFEILPEKLTARLNSCREKSIFFRFPLQIERNFVDVEAAFLDRGVHVRKGVDTLLHRRLGLGDTGFEKSVSTFEKTLSLPIYPSLSDEDVELIADVAKEVLG